jgi:hypothetical protein
MVSFEGYLVVSRWEATGMTTRMAGCIDGVWLDLTNLGVTMYSLIYFGGNKDDYDTLITSVSFSVTCLPLPAEKRWLSVHGRNGDQ